MIRHAITESGNRNVASHIPWSASRPVDGEDPWAHPWAQVFPGLKAVFPSLKPVSPQENGSWETKVLNRIVFTCVDVVLRISGNVQGLCSMCLGCVGGKIALNGWCVPSISYCNKVSITCEKFNDFRSCSIWLLLTIRLHVWRGQLKWNDLVWISINFVIVL